MSDFLQHIRVILEGVHQIDAKNATLNADQKSRLAKNSGSSHQHWKAHDSHTTAERFHRQLGNIKDADYHKKQAEYHKNAASKATY